MITNNIQALSFGKRPAYMPIKNSKSKTFQRIAQGFSVANTQAPTKIATTTPKNK